jgi:hypothetical protein
LAGRHVPAAATHAILGSLGGALAVAKIVGGSTGAALAGIARTAFMNGNEVSLAVGAGVALGGSMLALALLPGGRAGRPQVAGQDQDAGHPA